MDIKGIIPATESIEFVDEEGFAIWRLDTVVDKPNGEIGHQNAWARIPRSDFDKGQEWFDSNYLKIALFDIQNAVRDDGATNAREFPRPEGWMTRDEYMKRAPS